MPLFFYRYFPLLVFKWWCDCWPCDTLHLGRTLEPTEHLQTRWLILSPQKSAARTEAVLYLPWVNEHSKEFGGLVGCHNGDCQTESNTYPKHVSCSPIQIEFRAKSIWDITWSLPPSPPTWLRITLQNLHRVPEWDSGHAGPKNSHVHPECKGKGISESDGR